MTSSTPQFQSVQPITEPAFLISLSSFLVSPALMLLSSIPAQIRDRKSHFTANLEESHLPYEVQPAHSFCCIKRVGVQFSLVPEWIIGYLHHINILSQNRNRHVMNVLTISLWSSLAHSEAIKVLTITFDWVLKFCFVLFCFFCNISFYLPMFLLVVVIFSPLVAPFLTPSL